MSRKRPDPPEIAGYVDTHFHTLHSRKRGLALEEILDDAFASGMAWGIDIATGLENLEERLALAHRYPGLYLTVGCYPSYAENDLPPRLRETLTEQAAADAKIVAIGEIGLDYHWDFGTPERQRELFELQIRVADEAGLPVVIHCRDAQDDLLAALRSSPPRCGGVIHCFAGDREFAAGCLDQGMYISFAGTLTYKKADELRDVVRRVPVDRLLFETDAPYLAPEPLRGKTNRPDLVRYTYGTAAELTGLPVQKLADQVRENGVRLFNLPES